LLGGLTNSGLIYSFLFSVVLVVWINQFGWRLWVAILAVRLVMAVVMSPLPLLVVAREYVSRTSFGLFRFLHARLRVFAECIVIYHGEGLERRRLDEAFHDLIQKLKSVIWGQFWISLVAGALTELSIMFLAPMVALMGQFPAGDVYRYMLVTMASESLQMATSNLIMNLVYSGEMMGLANRVADLLDALEPGATKDSAEETSDEWGSSSFEAEDVLLCNPLGLPLQKALLSFEVAPGSRGLVIVGASGSGKTTLLRLLAGLVRPQFGDLRRPAREAVFFLPQRPYLVEGSLIDQVVYPSTREGSKEERGRALGAMDTAGLGALLERFDPDAMGRWGDMLSLGEQQRIGFARLFHRQVSFAIMDESTSSLDMDTEIRCMQACRDRNITLISVAHRPSVVPFHDRVLRLFPGGTHDIVPVAALKGQTRQSL